MAADKRGSHLSLTLERLQRLAERPITRIGLSATQKPIETVAQFLVGAGDAGQPPPCEIVDIGYTRKRDLALALPPTPLSVVMSNDQWLQVYADVARLAQQHRTTLVFVNTRRMAERAARHLGDLLGKQRVAAHHGSLSRETRLLAEQRLKAGDLTVLVATASLELGLDIGDVDLVCQLGSPRSIATFLQRAGRSGHKVGGTPKARLFPQTRDELVECAALLDSVRRGELDALRMPLAPIDVLAQQIVAEAACEDWDEDALFALVRRAWPFAQLSRASFDDVVRMLCDGFSTRLGPRAGYLHRDAVHRRLHARRGARMTALTSGGTIPETGDYSVVLEPQAEKIGTVNEDFAVESLTGDVFQLGNASYRILRVDAGRVRVEDAKGAPPNIPFWLGEAPGRREIEPVSQRDYARFLFEWQHVDGASRVAGPDALAGVVGQLEGFEAPAVLWESELLPARVRDYQPAWLDELCTAGRTVWARLRPGGGRGGAALRSTPIVLLPRRAAQRWSSLARDGDDAPLGSRAQRVAEVLQQQGALFFDEIADAARLMSTELEDALSELVMRGRAHCDSYAGLRALLVPASKRPSALSRHRRRASALGIRDAGRWAPVRALPELPLAEAGERHQDMLEHVAHTLLRRYGVVCWRLLEREAAWLPPWRELLRMYQRLEARGEIRGGRFIAGLSGEQFALPDAIAALRRVRAQALPQQWVCVSASDPSNLLGSLLPGERVARVPGNRVAYLDGLPMAVWAADRFQPLQDLSTGQGEQALRLLQRGPGAAEQTPMEQWLAQSPGSIARAPVVRGSGRDR